MRTLRLLFGLLLGALLVSGTAMALPMSGTYTIGNGTPADSFTSFTAAVAALTANGVGGAVTFDVEQLTYNESITIGQITGASATNTITFRAAGTLPPLISATDTTALNLKGADYVTFDGIDITLTATMGLFYRVVLIDSNADYNTIKNCTLTGTGETILRQYGVAITGGDNDYNVIDSVTVNRSACYPVYLAGDSVMSDSSNEVRTCTLIGGRYGVFLTCQNGSLVRNCDIQPGFVFPESLDVAGIYFYHTNTLGELPCGAYANKIHNIRGADTTSGIFVTSGVVVAYNNFVYDFAVTGTATVYGLRVDRGIADLRFNSVYIGDVGTFGNAYAFYQEYFLSVTHLLSNVFQVEEPTTACGAIYRSAGTLISDYNCVYGTGTGYSMGRDSVTNYATLALWQAGTADDSNSVEDNPGFIGPTDLHIQPDYTLLYGAGLDSIRPAFDIDGDSRGSPPAIGADEYTLMPMAHNYGVIKWVRWTSQYIMNVPVVIRAEVKNYGINNETNVPVRLFYNGVPQDTVLVSLTSGEKDTVELDWTPPVVAGVEEFDTLEVQAFCLLDTFLQNDSIRAIVRLYHSPLSGVYDLGGGANDFATIVAAVTALNTRGVDGPVTFNVYPITYSSGPIAINQIDGASATNTITFRATGTLDTPPLISSNAAPALNLKGADHVTFDGIDITLTVAGKVVRIALGADYNTIKNCTLTGTSQTNSENYGVHLIGAAITGSNNYNVIENVRVDRSAYYPVFLFSGSGIPPGQGNEVRNCTLIGGKQGVTLTCQSGAVVRNCDIQPGWDGAPQGTEIMGIYCAPKNLDQDSADERSVAYGNKIHNIRGTGVTNGINADPGTYSFFLAYNNFVYDFVVTGTKSLYGLRAGSGTSEFYFNSVLIGDVETTGGGGSQNGINGFYQAGTAAFLKNNIIQIDEPTAVCRAINRSAGTLNSDYNCVYGTGAGYSMGRDLTTDYPTLAAWQVGGLYDVHSLEGNPSFIGPTDLHIQPLSGLLNGAGLDVGGIATDIDGDGRGSPPDIGADEYIFAASAHDYGVNMWVGWTYQYTAGVPVVIRAEVQNYGINNETNVPVRLFYEGVQQDQVLLSLTVGEKDTVELDWTPPAHLNFDTLVVKAFCPSDTFAANDSLKASVLVLGPPMHGTYTIGDGTPADSFTSFTAAVTALTVCGVDGPVTFNVEQLTYSGSITIGEITGASETNTITFRAAGTLPPLISSATGSNTPVLYLNGADYVTFDGIDITLTATTGTSYRVVRIDDYADYNTIKNCTLTGTGQTGTNNYGIAILGGGNDYNVIENVRVDRTVYYPVQLLGALASSDEGNEVRNCTLIGGKQGVTLNYQRGAVVRNCDIQPGYDGATAEIMGIYCSTQTAGELFTAYGNKIHNIRGDGITNGIYAAPGTGCLFSAYNNFVYDYVVTGTHPLYGLRVASGEAKFYFNSVRIGDVGTTGNAYGFYQAGASTVVLLKNNIFQIDEPTTACWAVNHSAGTLTSDYNCVYSTGPGALYNMGRDAANDYATLALWYAGTHYDSSSVEGDPGFVSATDLHIGLLFTLVDSAGTPIEGITDDIDGDVRNAAFPDIGADEYNAIYPPAAVRGLTIFPNVATGDVLLRWPAAAGANSYKIYRGTVYGLEGTYVNQTAATTYTHIGALSLGVRMFYVVIASTDHIAR